jgi:hypothetical protein
VAHLSTLTVDDFEALRVGVHRAGAESTTMVEAASAITGLLLDNLLDAHGRPACISVRLHKTHPVDALPDDLRRLARGVAGIDDGGQCLVLLSANGSFGRAGGTPEDLVLPVVPPAEGEGSLMSRVLSALGVDVEAALDPHVALSRQLQQQTLSVYCEPDIAENESLVPNPAHREAMKQMGATTFVAAGGALPTGDLFLLTLVAREPVEDPVCDLFRLTAVAIKATLTPFSFSVFEP